MREMRPVLAATPPALETLYLWPPARRVSAGVPADLLHAGYWLVRVERRGDERRAESRQALLGVYIVNEKGEPIGFWHHALLRAFVGQAVLGGITFGIYTLLDYLWPLWDRHGQSLHDKVAGTYVVKRKEASPLGTVRASLEGKSDVWTEA